MNITDTPWAYVTGADRGLGLALCGDLLKRGYHVIAGLYSLTAAGKAAGIPGDGPECLARDYPVRLHRLPLDTSHTASVGSAAGEVRKLTDRLDLLVCNAAVLGDIEKTVLDDWSDADFELINRVYNTNATGTLRVITSVIDLLKRKGGEQKSHLVIISSEAGQTPQTWRKGWFGYCQSKAAVNSLGSLVHNGLEGGRTSVLLFHPGWMRSYMSGTRNEGADLEPVESAECILRFVLEENRENFGYFDYSGAPMAW